MLNLSVALTVRESNLPFICVIKGTKRRLHHLPDEYAEYLFIYDKSFNSIGSVALCNVVPQKAEDVKYRGRFSKKLKEELFTWLKENSEFSRLKISNYDLARNCSKFLHYTDEDSSEIKGKNEGQKIAWMFLRGSCWID